MKLKEYIRLKINNKFIPLVKKDNCELCGTSENLEVHHIKPFAEILEESLNELHKKYKDDINDYDRNELHMISNYIIGKHLNYKYMTLCHNCHKKVIHKNGTSNIGNRFNIWILNNKIKKEELKNKKMLELIPYLNIHTDIKLLENERKELINKIDLRDSRGRIQKAISQFNTYFEETKIPYIIESKRDNRRKLDDGKINFNRGKIYWIIHKKLK